MGVFSLLVLCAVPAAQAPSFPCGFDEAKLVAHDREGGDMFGQSLALSGATALVGAGGEDAIAAEAGAVYVFVRSGTSWAEEDKLMAADGGPGDQFGGSVGLAGDTAVIGARFHDAGGTDAGAAYVFVRNGTVWSQQAKLVASDAAAGAEFGGAVTVSGDWIVVGAPSESALANLAGAVYVFARNGTLWSEVAKLTASDASASDRCGWSVDLAREGAGARFVTGAPFAATGGAAYVFAYDGAAWSEEARLVAADAQAGDRFGHACAIADELVVVGAPLANAVGSDSGAAYAFARQAAVWSQAAKLVASDAAPQDLLGWSVACARDVAVAGAVWDDDRGDKSGAAYVFERVSGTWSEAFKSVAADGGAFDSLGVSVDVLGDTVAIGAYQASSAGPGSAYVVRSPGAPSAYCTAKQNSCGTLPAISASGRASASAASGFTVRAAHTKATKAGLLLYTDSGPNAVPFQGGTLCVGTMPLRRSVPVQDTTGTPGQCDGVLALDMNAFASGALGGHPLPSLLVPGTRLHAQFWGRDTLAHGSLLSDGLAWVVCP